MNEILPCPLCNSVNSSVDQFRTEPPYRFVRECIDCDFMTETCETVEETTELWQNNRHRIAATRAPDAGDMAAFGASGG